MDWKIKGAAVLFYTFPHLKKCAIRPFSFWFNPIKLPLTLQFMQNTDKRKMSTSSARREFKFHKITITGCCSLTAPCLIFHLQHFISSFSPHWPYKSQINFHLKCLTTDCCRKMPSSVLGNMVDRGKSYGNRSEKSGEEHKMQFLQNNSWAKWSGPLLETFYKCYNILKTVPYHYTLNSRDRLVCSTGTTDWSCDVEDMNSDDWAELVM